MSTVFRRSSCIGKPMWVDVLSHRFAYLVGRTTSILTRKKERQVAPSEFPLHTTGTPCACTENQRPDEGASTEIRKPCA